MSKFHKDAGKFITLVNGAQITQTFRVDQFERKKHKDFLISQFFGINKLNTLLQKPEVVGLRIYYGLDINGDGKRDKKFVLVGVDKDGNDIIPEALKLAAGMNKDTPSTEILDDGVGCPYDCASPNPLNTDKV